MPLCTFGSAMCSFIAFLSRTECQASRISLCFHTDDLSTISRRTLKIVENRPNHISQWQLFNPFLPIFNMPGYTLNIFKSLGDLCADLRLSKASGCGWIVKKKRTQSDHYQNLHTKSVVLFFVPRVKSID